MLENPAQERGAATRALPWQLCPPASLAALPGRVGGRISFQARSANAAEGAELCCCCPSQVNIYSPRQAALPLSERAAALSQGQGRAGRGFTGWSWDLGSFELQGAAPVAPCWRSQHGSMPSACLQHHSSLSPLVPPQEGTRETKPLGVGAAGLVERCWVTGTPLWSLLALPGAELHKMWALSSRIRTGIPAGAFGTRAAGWDGEAPVPRWEGSPTAQRKGFPLRETWKYLGLQTAYLEKITMLRVLLSPNSCLILYQTRKQAGAALWVPDR